MCVGARPLTVAAVILAAGTSSRLGAPKQLVELNGERLLDRAVRIAVEAGCHPVMVVLGAAGTEIQTACNLAGATVVHNPDWPEGMASSIRAAVNALPSATGGLLLLACDQPAVTASHLESLIAAARGGGDQLPVASTYAEIKGVPAFFPGTLFHHLRQLTGDCGARSLLDSALAVHLPNGEIDVDTAASLERGRQIVRES